MLETAEQRELLPVVTTAFIVKGAALGSQGRKREGIALISAAEELARENGLNQQLLRALIVGGYHRGDLDQMASLEGYREGLALARRLGHRNLMLRFINNIGYTGFLAGDWDCALAELEGVLAEDLDGGDRLAILCNALIVHVCRGEPVAEGIAEAERLAAEIGNPAMRVSILDVKGNAGLAEGRLEESGRAWREVARLDGSQGPEFLYRAARPALWSLDREAAAADLEALDATGVHGRVVEIRRLTIRAGLAALDGHVADAWRATARRCVGGETCASPGTKRSPASTWRSSSTRPSRKSRQRPRRDGRSCHACGPARSWRAWMPRSPCLARQTRARRRRSPSAAHGREQRSDVSAVES